MHIGICTCTKGADGSPCLHQAAVVFHYGEYGLHFTTTTSSVARQKLAQISLGDGISDMGFYSSLHQEALDKKYKSDNYEQVMKSSPDTVDGGDQRDFIHADVDSLHEEEATNLASMEETCRMIDYVANELEEKAARKPSNEQLFTGARKFAQRYLKYSSHQGNAMLASAFQRFGWAWLWRSNFLK